MNKSRTISSLKNVFFSFGYQIIAIILNFISRTIFLKYLGVEFLGINGLFGNILSVLSMVDLGMSTAMIYSLYEPLEKNDYDHISALVCFYGKIYHMIAGAVLVIGLIIMPFLSYMVNTEYEFAYLHIYYLMFLLNTVFSYLFVYKTVILNANQDLYIVKLISSLFIIIQFILQVIVLIFTQSFLLYLLVQVCCTLMNNIFTVKITNKKYPYIKNKRKLKKKEAHVIFNNVKSLFIYRIGGVILNNTDNIFISTLVGTVWVGIYSNYLMVTNAINQLFTQIFSAFTASVGNLNVTSDINKKKKVFYQLNIIGLFVYGCSATAILGCINSFVTLWLGETYIVSDKLVYIIVINYYLMGILNPIWIFRDTTGLFNKTKYITIFNSIINLLLSGLLGLKYGLYGILCATAIARLTTNAWYEPYILFKEYMCEKYYKFLLQHIANLSVIILTIICYSFIKINVIDYLTLFLNGIMLISIYTFLFVIIFHSFHEMRLLEKEIFAIVKACRKKIFSR